MCGVSVLCVSSPVCCSAFMIALGLFCVWLAAASAPLLGFFVLLDFG